MNIHQHHLPSCTAFNSSFKYMEAPPVCVCVCVLARCLEDFICSERPRQAESFLNQRADDLLRDGGVVLRPPSAASLKRGPLQRSIHQDETNESLLQLTVCPGKANSALLLKRVGVFNIVERRRARHPGTSLAFHQSAISLFLGGVVIFLPLAHTDDTKTEQSVFIVL